MVRDDIEILARPAPPPLQDPLLSIVVPAYNEADVLRPFHRRLAAVLDALAMRAEIVFVDDGSTDRTEPLIRELRAQDPRVALVSLSRNFGKEVALSAGIDYAQGDAVVVIDADLQDPPELIAELVRQWQAGYDVAYAKREVREGESRLKRSTAYAFYRLMQRAGRVRIPADTGDFRLLNRRAVDALKQLKERNRFMKGLFTWVGYRQIAVPYRRDARFAGQTKWNYWRLWNFALDGITSFTTAPLKMATYVGLAVSCFAFAFAALIIFKTLAYGDPVRGYPSLMVVVLFLGGVQLIFTGIIGEYLGRMFDETKARPLYFVREHEPSSAHQPGTCATTPQPRAGAEHTVAISS